MHVLMLLIQVRQSWMKLQLWMSHIFVFRITWKQCRLLKLQNPWQQSFEPNFYFTPKSPTLRVIDLVGQYTLGIRATAAELTI